MAKIKRKKVKIKIYANRQKGDYMVKLKHRLTAVLTANRHRIICTIICLMAMVTASAVLSLLNVVTVQDSERSKTVVSVFTDQDQLLSLAGFEPDENDTVLYTTFPGRYTNITITRSFDVPITVDGTTVNAHIRQGTVKDCLENAGVVLGELDYTEPSLNSPVEEGSSIRVFRVEYKDTQYEESVPFETEYKESSLTYRFKKRQYTLRDGVEGTNLVTYRERFVDGQLESSLVTKVEVVREPVNKVVLKYANKPVSPLSAPSGVTVTNNVPSRYVNVLYNVSATGYSSKGGRGASGLGLYCGTVAVNPNIIPYGSKLYITSPDGQFVYGFAIATDTGTALMNGTVGVDLYYDTYKESSLNWKNVVNVYVIE